jgi:hypothetical protein
MNICVIGRSPCDLRVSHVITLTNSGDVTLEVEWEAIYDSDKELTCSLTLPESVTIPPGRNSRCIFGATALAIGPISACLAIKTKEKVYTVDISGNLIIVTKSPRSKLDEILT